MSLETVDATVAGIASKTTWAGAAGSAIGWWSSVDWLGVSGFLVAAGGLAVNAYFKRRQDRRDQERLRAEMRERHERMRRAELESQARIAMMGQGHDPDGA